MKVIYVFIDFGNRNFLFNWNLYIYFLCFIKCGFNMWIDVDFWSCFYFFFFEDV